MEVPLKNDNAAMKRMLKRRENAKSAPTQIQYQVSVVNRPRCLRSTTPTESVVPLTGCAEETLRCYYPYMILLTMKLYTHKGTLI